MLFYKQAYRSYLLAYSSHSLKNIYDVHELDLQAVARAFGFTVPPRVSSTQNRSRGRGETIFRAQDILIPPHLCAGLVLNSLQIQ